MEYVLLSFYSNLFPHSTGMKSIDNETAKIIPGKHNHTRETNHTKLKSQMLYFKARSKHYTCKRQKDIILSN